MAADLKLNIMTVQDETIVDEDTIVLQEHEILFKKGKKPVYLFIVQQGKIALLHENKGRLIPFDILKKGDYICQDYLFHKGKLQYHAVALETTQILKIPQIDIKEILTECPEWVNEIMETLWNRLESSLNLLQEHQIFDDRMNTNLKLSKSVQEEIRDNLIKFKGISS